MCEREWGVLTVGVEPGRRRDLAAGVAAAAGLPDVPTAGMDEACTSGALKLIRRAQIEACPVAVVVIDADGAEGEPVPEFARRLLASDPSLVVVVLGADGAGGAESRAGGRLVRADGGTPAAILGELVCALAATSGESRSLRTRNAEMSAMLREHDAPHQGTPVTGMHDRMTGLPTRAALLEQIARARIRMGGAVGNASFAVLLIDLDGTNAINDSLGVAGGNELIRVVGERLQGSVRSLDAVSRGGDDAAARLGGDEFVVLLEGIRRAADAGMIADRLIREIGRPAVIEGAEVRPGASVGVYICDEPGVAADEAIRRAELALYRAKEGGKGGYAYYDPALHAEARERLRLENRLRDAVERSEFEVAYEPIISVSDGRLRGFEALMRWNGPGGGGVSPGTFIPAAERMGLIVRLGEWALNEVCGAIAAWDKACGLDEGFSVSVNISRLQLVEPDFLPRVRRAISRAGIEPSRLCFEVTESAVVEDMGAAVSALRAVKDMGIGVHMDDFGTGLSSLGCLHELPLDVLKIDRSFILNMRDHRGYAAVVQAVLTMASHLGFEVIAEGVESEAQLASLVSLDCDFVQGFHFSRALTAEQALAVIREPGALLQAA